MLLDSCTNKMYFQYLCELGPVASSREHKLPNFKLSHAMKLKVPSINCRDKHRTYEFLACDLESDCLKNDVLLRTSPDALTIPTSAWCDTSSTTDELYFLCSSRSERVPFTLVCDFREDCTDGSDENFCVHPPCSKEKQVPCGNSGQV